MLQKVIFLYSIQLTSSTFGETNDDWYDQNFHQSRVIHFSFDTKLYRHLNNGKLRSFLRNSPACCCWQFSSAVSATVWTLQRYSRKSYAVRLLYPLLPQIYAHYDDFSIPFYDFYSYLLAFKGDRGSTSHVCKNDLFDNRKRKLLFLSFEIWR